MKLNTYYTKCGREFPKSTKAETTGYTIDEKDKECVNCPFQLEVTEGWGENKKHVRWECRAGSKKPNHKNEWAGSTEDKNSIHIKSLDNSFLESVLEYCKGQPDLGAGYNQDLPDCRRTISVSCSSNKKGMAAKKALIEKFFPAESSIAEEQEVESLTCQQCELFGEYNGHTYECKHVWNTGKLGTTMPTIKACENFRQATEPDEEKTISVLTGTRFINSKRVQHCCNTEPNGGSCKHMGHWQAGGGTTSPEHTYIYCDLLHKKVLMDPAIPTQEDQKNHNITLLIPEECPVIKNNPEEQEEKEGEEVKEGTESVNESSEIVTKELESVTEFDYSGVDNETATFLQEKANKIAEIRIKSVIALGKELKEAHDKLANHYQGSFGKWCESIGLSRDSGNNYIRAYSYVAENFGNIEDANNIQPSLLFAISKPSAPEELQKAVLSGDITTNKEYQEALKAKAEAEQEAQRAIEEKKRAEFEAKEFERKYKARESTIESHKQALDEEKKRRYQLELDLRRAQEKGDSEEVKSLQLEIENYQSEIGSLNIKMQELKNQMKDKPIEVSALKVVEKLPDEIMDAIYKKVASLYETILNLTETEIQVFAQSVDPDQYDDIVQKISDAIGILNNIDTAVYETTKATLEAAATAEKKTTPCDDCQYGTRDGLRDEDEKNGMVNCTMYNTLVVNDRGCRNFAER